MPEIQLQRIEPAPDAAGRRAALLCVPAAVDPGQPRALAVMLHGSGGDPQQGLDLLAPWASQSDVLVLAPASASYTWDSVLGTPGGDQAAIERAIRWVQGRHPIDPQLLVVGGFSDGASCALGLGLGMGQVFRRIVALSPGFVPRVVPQGRPEVFISHGTHDTVLPISRCSRVIVARLRQLGYELTCREFDGGHVVPPEIARQAVAWLLRGGGPGQGAGGQSGHADSRETAF